MNLRNTLHGKQNAAAAGRAQSFMADRGGRDGGGGGGEETRLGSVLDFFIGEGGNLMMLPGTAHHTLELPHPRQNNMANVVSGESCKKQRAVPIHHVFFIDAYLALRMAGKDGGKKIP